MKKYLSLFIILFGLSSAFAETYTAKVTTKSGLVIRKEADIKSKKIGLVPFNEIVNIISVATEFVKIGKLNSPWYEIKYNNIEGFCYGAFLDLNYNNKEIFNITGTITDIVIGDFIHIDIVDSKGKKYSLVGSSGLPSNEVNMEGKSPLIGKKVKVKYKIDTFYNDFSGFIETGLTATEFDLIK